MQIKSLDHFNISTADLERSRRFYSEVVGFRDGDRPPFGKPGAWMYIGDHAILHIGTTRVPKTRRSDSFDHYAFRAEGIESARARLKQHDVEFDEYAVPARNLHQIFFRDPDGNEIELLFTGDEARAAAAAGVKVDSSVGRAKAAEKEKG
jgi:catechol 2,3-dioxygenase-like lactoylglutathione lyase family enzyme